MTRNGNFNGTSTPLKLKTQKLNDSLKPIFGPFSPSCRIYSALILNG